MGIGTVILITFFTALIVGLIVAYIKKMFWFQKSSGRKYSTVYSDDTKKVKGACANTDGTAGPAVTKSSECATACDAATTPPCLGYDWDGSSGCTLYATSPKTATKPTDETDKNECRALSK